jgi:hypothetical protein
MGKFSPDEKRRLFYNGVIDHRGNIRLDRIKDAERIIEKKNTELRKAYETLIVIKGSQTLLGIKIGECHIIGVFTDNVYLKCGESIKTVSHDFVIDYIKNSDYIERV